MKVIGVDPAPRKGIAVFDGEDRYIAVGESRRFVDELNTMSDLLVCWDSPLTGPPSSVVLGMEASGSAFSQRPVESFFRRTGPGFKAPPRISVCGYSGCPHWAMSRSLLGFPRTGPFDKGAVPFRLVAEDCPRAVDGHLIVEVHPALALWLWCRAMRPNNASWDYKRDETVRGELWDHICRVPDVARILSASDAPCSDDVLDARVAYTLGRLWLEKPASVVLLGDLDKGTFLLPNVDGLQAAFRSFSQTPHR
jgi:hypothetical protein